jgi:hypothetical protein
LEWVIENLGRIWLLSRVAVAVEFGIGVFVAFVSICLYRLAEDASVDAELKAKGIY